MAEEINLMNKLIEAMGEEMRAMKGRIDTAQPQPTGHCLEACHAPGLAMEVATDDAPFIGEPESPWGDTRDTAPMRAATILTPPRYRLDHLCIYRRSDSTSIPLMAVEYKLLRANPERFGYGVSVRDPAGARRDQ